VLCTHACVRVRLGGGKALARARGEVGDTSVGVRDRWQRSAERETGRQARYSHPYNTCTHNLGHKAGLTCGCRAPTSTVTNAPMSDAEVLCGLRITCRVPCKRLDRSGRVTRIGAVGSCLGEHR
jgi:hypothetical protein